MAEFLAPLSKLEEDKLYCSPDAVKLDEVREEEKIEEEEEDLMTSMDGAKQ